MLEYLVSIKGPASGLEIFDGEIRSWPKDWGDQPTDEELEDIKAAAAKYNAWQLIREERNTRLAKSDWTQFSDSPLDDAQKAAWAAYRQQLRDLPDDNVDPTDVTFPQEPA